MNRWGRMPVVVRAIVVGLAVGLFGSWTWSRLVAANTQYASGVPWATAVMAPLLVAWWLYFARGRGRPVATGEARRLGGRANRVPDDLWGPALTAGVLGLFATLLLQGVLARMATLPRQQDLDPSQYPALTVFAWLVMSALVSGYEDGQAPLQRADRHVRALRAPTRGRSPRRWAGTGTSRSWDDLRMGEANMTRGRLPRQKPSSSIERTARRVVLYLGASLMVVVLGGFAGETRGQVQQHAGHSLGTVDFPITCSEQAQVEFNRAVALLHHMTYPQAREAFQQVATIDPQCAMAHWGTAMTLFQPLWPTRPRPTDLQLGWEAVQRAKALQPPMERERLFLAAAEAFFLEPASSDYWLRIRRWEQAAERAFAALPDDPEVAAFYALALLATAPSDTISRAHADQAAAILLLLYERNPDHPGAMHYLVHANDVPGRERESLETTRKYEALAPRNPHALHMPTHIYTRLGDWNAVIRGNLRAAEAALMDPAGDHGEFVWDEFPHAIEYLVYADLQKGSDDAAAAQLKRLQATAHLEPTFKSAFHLASTQARYALERRAWNEAASIVPREPATLDWDRFTWPEAIARFARGLGAAHLGDVNKARAAGERLGELEAATRKAGEDLFARNIRVLRLELNAWLAHVQGQGESSIALMREAAELETLTPKHAVTPGPTLPAYELLGDLLMEQKRPAEALAAYRRSVELYPRRFNGLLGAARAARALGDGPLACSFYQELLEVADGGTRQPALKEAKSYVAQRR